MIDHICTLVGALLFAQFPQFFLQYVHQLAGHVSELAYQVRQLEQSAKLGNMSAAELIHKFLQNTDADVVRQGGLLRSMLERFDAMSAAQTALHQASVFTKPFLFIRYVQPSIAADTWQHFQLGFSFTAEGILYAFLGMVVGYSIYQAICALVRQVRASVTRKTV